MGMREGEEWGGGVKKEEKKTELSGQSISLRASARPAQAGFYS